MALFDYVGQLQSGAAFTGTLEADSVDHARATLIDMGLRITSLRPAKRMAYVAPLSLDDFLFFNEQVATMTKAGVPLEEGLRNLAADVGSRRLKKLLLDVAGDLASGVTLDEAVSRRERQFPGQYAGVVGAGLKTGDLGAALYGLTTHLRLKSGLRRAILEMSAYPLVILTLTLAITSLLMRVVVPGIESIAADLVGTHSFTTFRQIGLAPLVFEASRAWPEVEFSLVMLMTAGILIGLSVAPFRGVRERLIRRIPGVSRVYDASILARFSHTSALAAHAGAPLHEMIAASGAASGSVMLADASRRVAERLIAGESLDAAASVEARIPALWVCVVNTAAQRGALAPALEELARNYELRAQQHAAAVRFVLGPLLVVAVASLLAVVIGSVLSMFMWVINAVSR